MTAVETDISRHYSYPLLTWGSTLLGGVVALITSLMLNLLGAALGIAAAAIGQSAGASATAGIAGIVWVAIANLVALGFGAWVAARSTANPDHHGVNPARDRGVGGDVVRCPVSRQLSDLGCRRRDDEDGRDCCECFEHLDRSASEPFGCCNSCADSGAGSLRLPCSKMRLRYRTAQPRRPALLPPPRSGPFLAMVLGLVAAIFGARMGARHPSWADRPRYTYVERRH